MALSRKPNPMKGRELLTATRIKNIRSKKAVMITSKVCDIKPVTAITYTKQAIEKMALLPKFFPNIFLVSNLLKLYSDDSILLRPCL